MALKQKQSSFLFGPETVIWRRGLAHHCKEHKNWVSKAESYIDTRYDIRLKDIVKFRSDNPRWLLTFQEKEHRVQNDAIMDDIKCCTPSWIDCSVPVKAMAASAWRQSSPYTQGGNPRSKQVRKKARADYATYSKVERELESQSARKGSIARQVGSPKKFSAPAAAKPLVQLESSNSLSSLVTHGLDQFGHPILAPKKPAPAMGLHTWPGAAARPGSAPPVMVGYDEEDEIPAVPQFWGDGPISIAQEPPANPGLRDTKPRVQKKSAAAAAHSVPAESDPYGMFVRRIVDRIVRDRVNNEEEVDRILDAAVEAAAPSLDLHRLQRLTGDIKRQLRMRGQVQPADPPIPAADVPRNVKNPYQVFAHQLVSQVTCSSWFQGAFEKLDSVFGTMTRPSSTRKHNGTPYRLPQLQMKNSDLSRLINSDEVQSVVNAPKVGTKARGLKLNPLKNKKAMEVLNPAASASRERFAKQQKAAEKAKADLVEAKRKGKAKPSSKKVKAKEEAKKGFYAQMIAD